MFRVQTQHRDHDEVPNSTQGREEMRIAAQVENQHHEDDDHTISAMELPPLEQAMSMVGIFLNSYNSVLPLFHADTLLHLISKCYAQ